MYVSDFFVLAILTRCDDSAVISLVCFACLLLSVNQHPRNLNGSFGG
jgi:hypothetical protein